MRKSVVGDQLDLGGEMTVDPQGQFIELPRVARIDGVRGLVEEIVSVRTDVEFPLGIQKKPVIQAKSP